MDMAFRNRRRRWAPDGHELAGGSVVEVNVCDRWIGASVEHDNNRLRDYCLLPNGDGARLMSTTLKMRRPGNGARAQNGIRL